MWPKVYRASCGVAAGSMVYLASQIGQINLPGLTPIVGFSR